MGMADNQDIQGIFDHWNQASIIVHKRLDRKMASVIGYVLDDGYPKEELMEAITVYATVLKSPQSRWTYKWRIEEFFQRTPGFRRFLLEDRTMEEVLQGFFQDGNSYGSGSTTPPVLSVSPSFKEDFLNKKRGGFKND